MLVIHQLDAYFILTPEGLLCVGRWLGPSRGVTGTTTAPVGHVAETLMSVMSYAAFLDTVARIVMGLYC